MPARSRRPGGLGAWLNKRDDWPAFEDAYVRHAPWSYVVVDDFLRPARACGLRDALLAHWSWRRKNADSGQIYLPTPELSGAEELAAEVQEALPRVLGNYAFVEHWAFLHRNNNGLSVHTDVGAVSLDLWLTPDESNVGTSGGGLVLYRLRRPDGHLSLDEFNTSRWTEAYVARADPTPLANVPYKWNRAVIFDARMFHETAPLRFACDDSTSTRMNFNLLFDNLSVHRNRRDRYQEIYARCEDLLRNGIRPFDSLDLDAAEAIWEQAERELAAGDDKVVP